ncbi:MAG: recombinase family protein [Candidatus Jacksonbacteria bacterium]
MQSIILARVSTEEQMAEGQSIPAQLSRAREYAKKKGLTIKSEYQFDESSIKDHRTKFEQVIEEIKKAKEPIALIVETVDRLQRSYKESVLLDDYRKQGKLELHFIRENLVIHKNSNSSEIQRWDLAVFVAKSFVLQISDNVKRTNELKIKKGEWCGKATIGYLNTADEQGNKDIEPDPLRAHFIPKIFEFYATGNSSIRSIKKEMDKQGLKSNTKTPKSLTPSTIEHILNNPFYYGMMRIKDELYPHRYAPLISKELFDKCQAVKNGYHKKPFKYGAKPYLLRGLIKCADCGCTITPETSKGHIYYSCTNYKNKHKKRLYVKESDLLSPINRLLQNISLPDEKIKRITNDLKSINESKNQFYSQTVKGLRQEYDKIEKRLSNMSDLLFDSSITTDIYDKKLKEYKERQQEIISQMSQYDQADKNYYITVNTVLNLAQRAYEIFSGSELDTKRQILNLLLQNPELKDKNLHFKLKAPFDTVLQASKCSKWLPGSDSNRQPTGYTQSQCFH